jgi:hypothetical protein
MAHSPTVCGNRSGTWSVSVFGNWRTMLEQWTGIRVIHGAKGQGATARRFGFRPGHCPLERSRSAPPATGEGMT